MPAILAVCASEPYLVLERLPAGNGREPLGVVSLEIIGMRRFMPTRSGDLFWLHAAVLDKSAVHVRIRAIRQGTPYDRRNRVDHVAQLGFLRLDRRISVMLLGHLSSFPPLA